MSAFLCGACLITALHCAVEGRMFWFWWNAIFAAGNAYFWVLA